jgi:hypothetical protein
MTAVDAETLYEPEADDVAIEIRVADDLQRVENMTLLYLHIVKNIVHSRRMPETTVSPNRSVMIVLAYLWVLALIPLLVEKHDAEVQWHAKHGLVLTVAELVLLCAYILMTSIISLATLGLGCVLSLLLVFAWIGIIALHVAAILKGINGGRLIVPGVSEYVNRF